MKTRQFAFVLAFIVASGGALAFEGGVRKTPARDIPVPDAGVSPAMQALIGAPLPAI